MFRDGLDALLAALEVLPGLTPLGVVTFARMIRQALVNRLRFVGDSAPRRDLNSPVIITGLPRSGTTALHRLLALDRVFHAPPLWELLDPFSTAAPVLRRWRTTAQISFKNRLLPDLDPKHFTRADTPEECTLLLANSLRLVAVLGSGAPRGLSRVGPGGGSATGLRGLPETARDSPGPSPRPAAVAQGAGPPRESRRPARSGARSASDPDPP